MKLTPGAEFLIAVSPTLVGPALAAYALVHYLGDQLFPGWPKTALKIVLCVIATPSYIVARYYLARLNDHVQARKLNAQLPPSIPHRYPFAIDLIIDMMKKVDSEYAGDGFLDAMEKVNTNTINFRAMGENRIMTIEPHFIKQILATGFTNYVKGPNLFGEATRSVLGTGVFNADGDMWKFHRTLARPFFSRDRVSDFELFARHGDHVISKMNESFRQGRPIDFQDAVARFTLDSATEFLFGECVNSIEEPFALPFYETASITPAGETNALGVATDDFSSATSTRFVKAFGTAQDLISRRVRCGSAWKVLEMSGDKSLEHVKAIREYLEPVLAKALQKRAEAAEAGTLEKEVEEGMTLLDYIVRQTTDKDILRDQILNMLIAGRDTTACLLTFVTYMLSQHPHVLEKLRAEILGVVGTDRIPTYDDIREMKYLRAVLNETLRLFPPVPFDYRETIKADVWTDLDGRRWYIPAKTPALYGVLFMHRRTDLWGPDALDFDPERWIDKRLHRITENPFMFLPFNAGPRICLGQQFAYNESSFFLVRLLQKFDGVTLASDAQPPFSRPKNLEWDLTRSRNGIEKIWPRVHLTLFVEGGLWLNLKEASGSD